LEQVLHFCVAKTVFNSIESHIKELLSILLLSSIGRIAIEIFEGEAKLKRLEVLSLAQFQMCHQSLQLMHHIVIDSMTFVLLDIFGLTIIY
jgi:hypothetical protein